MDLRQIACGGALWMLLAWPAGPALADVGVIPLGARFDLTPSPGGNVLAFGSAVAISRDGTTALVGADSEFCSECGGVFVYHRGPAGWVFEAELPVTSGGAARAVALSADGSVAAVGSQTGGPCAGCGSAAFFRRGGSGWVQEAFVHGSHPFSSHRFGYDVALSDDGKTAVVTSDSEFCGPLTCGAAYVYRESGGVWTDTARLTVPDSTQGAFGQGLALSADGSRLIVGAPFTDCPGLQDCGRVHVFDEVGGVWSLTSEIAPPFPQFQAGWGQRVAIDQSGRLALISAPSFDCAEGAVCGAVEVFGETGGSWTLQARFTGSAEDRLGHGVALSADGTRALAGAPGAGGCGEALLFELDDAGWRPAAQLAAPPPAGGFGHAVALDAAGRAAVIWAPTTPCGTPGSVFNPNGTAYVFEDIALTAVPTAGTAALVLLALSLAAAGTFVLRRL